MKPPNGKYEHFQVVALVSPEIRDAIGQHRNRLYIGLESFRVYDRFNMKRCNKCNGFGHYKDSCEKSTMCGYCCSGDHESENCPKKTLKDPTSFKCVNCKRDGLDGEGHSASWFKCPAYITAQKKVEGTIPYYEGLKNRNRRSVY